jgi:hypothetical protein
MDLAEAANPLIVSQRNGIVSRDSAIETAEAADRQAARGTPFEIEPFSKFIEALDPRMPIPTFPP